jgi:hypothetical protein
LTAADSLSPCCLVLASEVLINLAGTGAGQGSQTLGHNVAINQIVGTIGWHLNNGHVDVGGYPFLVGPSQTAAYNSTQIAAAATLAAITKRGLKFPVGVTLVDSECITPIEGIIGHGQETTEIRATTAMTRMFTLYRRATSTGVYYNGNNLAKSGVAFTNSNGSLFQMNRLSAFKLDGIDFLATGNNSGTRVDGCWILSCGSVYNTGTASGTAGGTVVTITGAADLTTFVRPKRDMWKTATNDANQCNEIIAVTANTITVYPPISTTFTAQPYAIHQGSGIDIQNQGDNSKIVVSNTTVQGCKVGAISNKALYGAYIQSCVFEVNEYHVITGTRGSANPTYGTRMDGNYSEFAFNDASASLCAYHLGEGMQTGYEGTHAYRYYSGSLLMLELGSDAQQVKQGTPVDASGALLVFSSVSSQYVKTGRIVTVGGTLTYPTTATGNAAFIDSLAPFIPLSPLNSGCRISTTGTGGNDWALVCVNAPANRWGIQTLDGAAVANSALSGRQIRFSLTYFT